MTEYVAYKGDKVLGVGTIQELADGLGFTYQNMKYRTYPYAHKKMGEGSVLLYEIEEDEENDNQF